MAAFHTLPATSTSSTNDKAAFSSAGSPHPTGEAARDLNGRTSYGYNLYSVQGSYLGPSSIHHITRFDVTSIRTTRSFCTRLVVASQRLASKDPAKPEHRKTLICILEFHNPSPTWQAYSSAPLLGPISDPALYPDPSTLQDTHTIATASLLPEVLRIYTKTFDLARRTMEFRPLPTSTGGSNLMGVLPENAVQGDRPITQRTSAHWVRIRDKLVGQAERCAGLGFLTDCALAFVPLTLLSLPLSAASAVASLDFSLRIHSPPSLGTNPNVWHLHEQHTEHAADGRTYSVGRVFDRDGKEVGVMSQVSILTKAQTAAEAVDSRRRVSPAERRARL